MKNNLKFTLIIMLIFCSTMIFSNSVNATTTTQEEELEVNILTDKENYTKGENIQITVNIKNNNPYKIEDISIETLVPDGLELTKGVATDSKISLASGESYTNTTELALKKVEETKPVKENKIPTIINNIKDTIKSPVTGDNFHLNIYFSILIISTIIVIAILVRKKYSRK